MSFASLGRALWRAPAAPVLPGTIDLLRHQQRLTPPVQVVATLCHSVLDQCSALYGKASKSAAICVVARPLLGPLLALSATTVAGAAALGCTGKASTAAVSGCCCAGTAGSRLSVVLGGIGVQQRSQPASSFSNSCLAIACSVIVVGLRLFSSAISRSAFINGYHSMLLKHRLCAAAVRRSTAASPSAPSLLHDSASRCVALFDLIDQQTQSYSTVGAIQVGATVQVNCSNAPLSRRCATTSPGTGLSSRCTARRLDGQPLPDAVCLLPATTNKLPIPANQASKVCFAELQFH